MAAGQIKYTDLLPAGSPGGRPPGGAATGGHWPTGAPANKLTTSYWRCWRKGAWPAWRVPVADTL